MDGQYRGWTDRPVGEWVKGTRSEGSRHFTRVKDPDGTPDQILWHHPGDMGCSTGTRDGFEKGCGSHKKERVRRRAVVGRSSGPSLPRRMSFGRSTGNLNIS